MRLELDAFKHIELGPCGRWYAWSIAIGSQRVAWSNVSMRIRSRIMKVVQELLYPDVTDLQLPNPVKIIEFREVMLGWSVSGLRIIDLGCGAGVHSALLASKGALVTAVDPDPANITYANEQLVGKRYQHRIRYLLGTLDELKLPDSAFDAVVSFGVLEHVQNPVSTLAFVTRLLRPGGALHLTADAMSHVRDADFIATFAEAYDVRRFWDAESVATIVSGAGLTPFEVRYILSGPSALAEVVHHIRTRTTRTARQNRVLVRRVEKEERCLDQTLGGQFVLVRARKQAGTESNRHQ